MGTPKFKNPLDEANFSKVAEKLRNAAMSQPVDTTITSTLRTPEYNKSVGGKPNSQHLTGGALDLRIRDLSPDKVAALKNYYQQSGFQVINEGDHLHVQHGGGYTGGHDHNIEAPVQLAQKIADPQPSGIGSVMGSLFGSRPSSGQAPARQTGAPQEESMGLQFGDVEMPDIQMAQAEAPLDTDRWESFLPSGGRYRDRINSLKGSLFRG